MLIPETIVIERTVPEVWMNVVSSEQFRKWNEHLVGLETTGRFVQGQTFAARYKLREKLLQCICTVTALEEGRRLELLHAHCVGDGIDPRLSMRETITLAADGNRTIVRKDVDIQHHGIPWPWYPLVWLIARFGTPVAPNKLKRLCEDGV